MSLRRKDVFEQRNFSQPWRSRYRNQVFFFEETAHDIGLALFEANRLLGGTLADDRFRDAADRNRTLLLRSNDFGLQRNIAVEVHRRCDFDLYANIQIGELRVHQGANDSGRRAGLVRTSGYRDALPDL